MDVTGGESMTCPGPVEDLRLCPWHIGQTASCASSELNVATTSLALRMAAGRCRMWEVAYVIRLNISYALLGGSCNAMARIVSASPPVMCACRRRPSRTAAR